MGRVRLVARAVLVVGRVQLVALDVSRSLGARVVRFPSYDASHAITLDPSPELREDIASWLADG